MSETMLDKLADFFSDKDMSMECHEYCAHSTAPYTRQEIRKEFKTYEAMLSLLQERTTTVPEPLKVEIKEEVKVKDTPKPKAKGAKNESKK